MVVASSFIIGYDATASDSFAIYGAI